jgi:transposase-like protein
MAGSARRWLLIAKALLDRKGRCTICGSKEFRRSGLSMGRTARFLGLQLYRCQRCNHHFALRRRAMNLSA